MGSQKLARNAVEGEALLLWRCKSGKPLTSIIRLLLSLFNLIIQRVLNSVLAEALAPEQTRIALPAWLARRPRIVTAARQAVIHSQLDSPLNNLCLGKRDQRRMNLQ